MPGFQQEPSTSLSQCCADQMRVCGLGESTEVSVGQEHEKMYGMASACVDNPAMCLATGWLLREWAGKA